MVQSLQTELNLWFLDDGTIAGPPELVLEAMKFVMGESEKLGLVLNQSKCGLAVIGGNMEETEIIIINFRDLASEIQVISPDNSKLLGAPLTDKTIKTVMDLKTKDFSTLSSRLSHLSSHSAFYLLRLSVSTPRLIYFLRCSPSWHYQVGLDLYDAALNQFWRLFLIATCQKKLGRNRHFQCLLVVSESNTLRIPQFLLPIVTPPESSSD